GQPRLPRRAARRQSFSTLSPRKIFFSAENSLYYGFSRHETILARRTRKDLTRTPKTKYLFKAGQKICPKSVLRLAMQMPYSSQISLLILFRKISCIFNLALNSPTDALLVKCTSSRFESYSGSFLDGYANQTVLG